MQYTAWPELDVPTSTDSIISLVKEVEKQIVSQGQKTCTILIHCSAGVGQTGTFIALYLLMEQLQHIICGRKIQSSNICSLNSIDIFNMVRHLRSRRGHMVSWKYKFSWFMIGWSECKSSTNSISISLYITEHEVTREQRSMMSQKINIWIINFENICYTLMLNYKRK